MSKLIKFFDFIQGQQPTYIDEEHHLYVFEIDNIPFKTKSSTFKNLFMYLSHIVCSADISVEYLKQAYKEASHILIMMNKGMQEIQGFCFMNFNDYATFLNENKACVQNYDGLELQPKIANISNVLYIRVLCSKPRTKCGRKIIQFLENKFYQYKNYQALALHSTHKTYSYYTKLGFYRTNNLQDLYPVFEKDNKIMFNNTSNIGQIRKEFSSKQQPQYSYFNNEFCYFYMNFQYLFMKPTNLFYGGKFTELVMTRIRKRQESQLRSSRNHRRTNR